MNRWTGLLIVGVSLPCAVAIAEQAGVALMVPPPIAETVASAPRLDGDSAAARAINAVLEQQDQYQRDGWTDCGLPDGGDYSADYQIDMAGPDYLAITQTVGGYCPGAAHPFWFQDHLVFDLKTGAETDLRSDLPPVFAREGAGAPDPALTALYLDLLAAAGPVDPDCAEVIGGGGFDFQVWPAAAERGLGLVPSGLPHVVTACAEPVYVPLDALAGLGASPRLLAALEQGIVPPQSN